MAMFDNETLPPGYRWEYSGSGNTAVRYPVLDAPAGEGSDRPIAPHREVPGEVPDAVPTLDQMRFELSQQPQSSLPSLPDYLMNLPREIRDQAAALGEVGASTFFGMLSPIVGAAAGVGKNIYDYFDKGKINPAATKDFANTAAGAVTYQPVIPSAQHIMQLLGEAPAAIMGTGQGLPPVVPGINPRALQPPRGTTGALTAGVKRDISQFDNDVFNAQRGITPGYPTLGSEFSDAFVTPRPTVYDMLAGLEPSRIPSTASPAVKTKGGNFPTSFDNDLEVSGQVGRHLDKLLKRVTPAKTQFPGQFDTAITKQYRTFLENKEPKSSGSLPLMDEFISTHKEQFPQLKTLAELEALEQAEKAFITNQYARYLTNEMGTGAKTDTLVRLAEQGIAVPEIAEVFDANYPGRAADLEGPWVLPAVKNLLTANKLKGIEAVQQTATTPFGKYIESLADEGVTPTSKKLYEDLLTLQKKLGLPTKYADKPTPFERVPEDMPIWDLPELWSNTELGLDRVLQKLSTDIKSGVVNPENVKNVSIESLVRGLMNENLQKLAAEAKELSSFETVYQRPGSKNVWKNITNEDTSIPVKDSDAKTTALHKRVADKMGICIGNADYCQRAVNQEAFHNVLFSPNGEPHVAIESRPATLLRSYLALPEADKAMLNAKTAAALGYTLNDAMGDKNPTRERNFEEARAELYTDIFGYPPKEIYQVKGKGNATNLDPKYIEDTRDFLNSQDWLPSSASSKDFNKKSVTIGGLVDTQYDDSLDAYARRAKFSGFDEVLNRFEAAKLLGRQLPGRFATDKDITEFINGPETLQYNHGSPTGGMTELRTDIDRTRAAGTGLWLAQPYETAGTYAGMKGSIYNVEVKNKNLDVFDAKNSEGGNIPLDTILYHADGTISTGAEIAKAFGIAKLTTDDLAKYSKSKGAKGLHILNVADISGRANPFVNTAPDYANNLVVFDPAIVKVIKEDKAPPFVPAGKAENIPGLTVYRGGNQDLDALTKRYNGVYYTTEPKTASQYGEVKQYELPGNLKTFKLWSNNADKNFIHDEPKLRAILEDLGVDQSNLADAGSSIFINPPKNLGEVLRKHGYDSMQAHDMLFVPAGKAEKPLTEKQFYSRYSQHVDIRNRENQQGAETLKNIQESGWKPGFSVNTLPPYQGGIPTNVVDKKLAPRTGDYVYLVPNTFTTKTGNGLKINEGWIPKAHEAFQVTEDYPNMYKEYLKAFNAKAEGGAIRMADGGAVTDTLDKMVKSPQASTLLNLDLPNLIAAKQQARPMKRGGKVDFSNNIDDMRYALTRRQG